MRGRVRWWWAGVALVIMVAVAARGPVLDRDVSSAAGESGSSGPTASSSLPGFGPDRLVTVGDGEWRTDETRGAWVELSWGRAREVGRVVLVGGAERTVLAGYLSFGDGSRLHVVMAPGTMTRVSFTPRVVDSVRFTVSETMPATEGASLEALEVQAPGSAMVNQGRAPRGDAAGLARLSAPGEADGGLGALVDDRPATSVVTPRSLVLRWQRPQELASVVVGAAPGGPSAGAGQLVFSDGSSVTVAGVGTDALRPTVVGFMPRVTTSLRLTWPSGGAPERLSLLRAKRVDARPYSSPGGRPAQPPERRRAGFACDQDPDRPASALGVVVACPTSGTEVGDTLPLLVSAAPEVTVVSARAWSAEPAVEPLAPVSASVDRTGLVSLSLDLSPLPRGPVTVAVTASGTGPRVAPVTLAVVHTRGARSGSTAAAPPGRHLVFREEFRRPLSIGHAGTPDLVSGKPTDSGTDSFGDAPFADPGRVGGHLDVVDEDYLRLSVKPREPETGESGTHRHLGAMVASARTGGSGVAVQYGFFEARLFGAAAPGTWPAFWTLPAPNLVTPQQEVAEFDAVELYGHDPLSGCHATHGYRDGADSGEVRCQELWETYREALAWHVYGMDVAPEEVTFFVDGVEVLSLPQVPGGDEPMFWLLDLALGGGWPVDLRASLDRADLFADWVRVYV